MEEVKLIKGKLGSIRIFTINHHTLIAKPSGYISPRMIREDFEFVKHYKIVDFQYFVDLTNFVVPNPLNIYYLSKLTSIQNLKQYIIATNDPLLKIVLKVLKPKLKFSKVISLHDFELLKKELQ